MLILFFLARLLKAVGPYIIVILSRIFLIVLSPVHFPTTSITIIVTIAYSNALLSCSDDTPGAMDRRKLQNSQSARRLVLPSFVLVVVISASFYYRDVILNQDGHSGAGYDGHANNITSLDGVARFLQITPLLNTLTTWSETVQSSTQITGDKSHRQATNATFLESLAERASPDKDVLIAYVDSAFVDMALNFHATSLRRHDITNFLFVSSDHKCCDVLHRAQLPCYVHKLDKSSDQASTYGSRDFIRKMNYRTDVILEALENHYTVLHTDTDMVFLKNPFHYLRTLPCDIAVMMEKPGLYNAGFVFVRPTQEGTSIYRRMRADSIKRPFIDDQTQLNDAITDLKVCTKCFDSCWSIWTRGLNYSDIYIGCV